MEVCILKRPDGKLVGCAFIQFENVQEATEAVKNSNNKELMGRALRVQFAVSKQDYGKHILERDNVKTEIKEEEAEQPDERENDYKKKKKSANDAEDGFTVFVKNLNFDTTNEEFAAAMTGFGAHKYALITREPVSNHSKGTGFVRFMHKESADLCLQNSGKITLKDFTLEFLPAMSRDGAKKLQAKEEKSVPKDKRNLYM